MKGFVRPFLKQEFKLQKAVLTNTLPLMAVHKTGRIFYVYNKEIPRNHIGLQGIGACIQKAVRGCEGYPKQTGR
jgi:hypothetical protein